MLRSQIIRLTKYRFQNNITRNTTTFSSVKNRKNGIGNTICKHISIFAKLKLIQKSGQNVFPYWYNVPCSIDTKLGQTLCYM